MISFKRLLKEKYGVPDNLARQFLSSGKHFSLTTDKFLLQKGQRSELLYFIETGIVREYVENNDAEHTEKTTQLIGAGNLAFNVDSYMDGLPADCYLQTLTKTTGIVFTKKDLELLFLDGSVFSHVGMKLYRDTIKKLNNLKKLHSTENGLDRLQLYEQQHPQLVGKIKLMYVASFLSMSKEHLSRLRKRFRDGEVG